MLVHPTPVEICVVCTNSVIFELYANLPVKADEPECSIPWQLDFNSDLELSSMNPSQFSLLFADDPVAWLKNLTEYLIKIKFYSNSPRMPFLIRTNSNFTSTAWSCFWWKSRGTNIITTFLAIRCVKIPTYCFQCSRAGACAMWWTSVVVRQNEYSIPCTFLAVFRSFNYIPTLILTIFNTGTTER